MWASSVILASWTPAPLKNSLQSYLLLALHMKLVRLYMWVSPSWNRTLEELAFHMWYVIWYVSSQMTTHVALEPEKERKVFPFQRARATKSILLGSFLSDRLLSIGSRTTHPFDARYRSLLILAYNFLLLTIGHINHGFGLSVFCPLINISTTSSKSPIYWN